jgi:hypothetical protein
MNVVSGIRTRDPSNRAAAALRFRTRARRDWMVKKYNVEKEEEQRRYEMESSVLLD